MSEPIERLRQVMAALRDPAGGCPWDLAQDHHSLIPYLVEETYEVIDAIERGEPAALREELGDLLFQIVFHARLGEERGEFDLDQVAAAIADKLVSRHPHVFAGRKFASDAERDAAWEAAKQAERARKGERPAGFFDDVHRAQPALMRAQALQRRAARVGFDWPDARAVLAKVREESDELEAALAAGEAPERLAEEVGDLLFAVVNLSRHLGIDAEEALRRGNEKFVRRFEAMRERLGEAGQTLEGADADTLEAAWQATKAAEGD